MLKGVIPAQAAIQCLSVDGASPRSRGRQRSSMQLTAAICENRRQSGHESSMKLTRAFCTALLALALAA